jgi:hypothetical protein
MGCLKAIDHMINTKYSLVLGFGSCGIVLMLFALIVAVIWIVFIVKGCDKKPETAS